MASSTSEASASGSPFAQTLKAISQLKYSQLDKAHSSFKERHNAALAIANDDTLDAREKVTQLIRETRRVSGQDPDATTKHWRDRRRKGIDWNDKDLPTKQSELLRLEAAANLAAHDRNVSAEQLTAHVDRLAKGFGYEEQKYVYAELFAKLLGEWLDHGADEGKSSGENKEEGMCIPIDVEVGSKLTSSPVAQPAGRAEMHEQRAQFEEYVYSPLNMDKEKIEKYLEGLFTDTVQKRKALEDLRTHIKHLCDNTPEIDEEDVTDLIQGLIKSDLLSSDKQATLGEFKTNPVIRKELADVLNMHYASFSTWSWPEEGVQLHMRRQLNEKYRVYMDEEILTALFIHSVGHYWANQFLEAFNTFFNSPAWKKSVDEDLTKEESDIFEYFFGDQKLKHGTIEQQRRAEQQSTYFMPMLTAEVTKAQGGGSYDDDSNSNVGSESKVPGGAALKQSLLRMMSTESALSLEMHGQHTTICSDFKWFGPSLSHDSILATLKFFGVSEQWLKWFKTFLEVPTRFVQDGPDAPLRTRKRGTPMSHSLSCMFGETVMFVMDYAVNQNASGVFLYRVHDDMWIWNHKQEHVVKAWEAMGTFAAVMGLDFNPEKTGALTVGSEPNARLPNGTISWGFLTLSSSGEFVIDQKKVDSHIAELRQQLSGTQSIFSWVRAYNRYMQFFLNNFAHSARCFGVQHISQVELTLQRVHSELFPQHNGSAVQYLSSELERKFGITGIPTGWFFWPGTLGGLELLDPFINVVSCRNRDLTHAPFDDMTEEIEELLEEEEAEYQKLAQDYEDGTLLPVGKSSVRYYDDKPPFPTFDEFQKCRQSRSTLWGKKYEDARELHSSYRLQIPMSPEITGALTADFPFVTLMSGRIRTAVGSMDTAKAGIGAADFNFVNTACVNDLYWQYVLAAWGKGVYEKWGGLKIIMPNMLPVGMMSVYRSRRIDWEQ